MRHNGFSDLLVVRCSQLGPVLQALIDDHTLAHSNDNGYGQWGGNDQTTGLSWLAEASGLAERRIWSIISGETQHTGLRIADQLLMAADMPHLLQDGTIEVIPNPGMTQETWAERMSERGCY